MVPLNWLVTGYDLGVGAIDKYFCGQQAKTSKLENKSLLAYTCSKIKIFTII